MNILNSIWRHFFKYDIYLSGPMRGLPDDNRELFNIVVSGLRGKGYSVYSPPEKNKDGKKPFSVCITQDLYAIMHKCKKLVVLPGWRESEGASLEVLCALNCGIPVKTYEYSEDHSKLLPGYSVSVNKKPFSKELCNTPHN